MKKPWLLVLAGAALAGLLAAWLLTSAPRGVPVQTAAVERRQLRAPVTAAGEIEPRARVNVSARVIGRIDRLYVHEGDRVKRGQKLVDLDRQQYESQVAAAQAFVARATDDASRADASLESARVKLRRAQSLAREKIASREFLDAAQLEVKTAQEAEGRARDSVRDARASLESAEDALSRTSIDSPISGRVTALNAGEGETVVDGVRKTRGTVILTISDMSVIDAEVDAGSAAISRLAGGEKATVTVDAVPGRTYAGRVTEIEGSAARIRLQDPDDRLRPGMKARALIEAASRPDALVVPIGAVVGSRRAGRAVYRIENGKARAVAVTLGLTTETRAEVTSGLKMGETIISGPDRTLKSLKDGDDVSPSPGKKE